MKKNKVYKLSTLLILYLFVFTILFLFLFIFIHDKTNTFFTDLIWSSLDDGIQNYEEVLSRGEFDKIPKDKLFGKSGYFDVLDEQLNTVYSSDTPHNYTKEDIKYIKNIDDSFFDVIDLKNNQTLIIKFDQVNNNNNNMFYILNDERKVINSNDVEAPKAFSEKQLELMSSYIPLADQVYSKTFIFDGKKYTLVAYEARYMDAFREFDIIRNITKLIYGIIYVLTLLYIIFILNKKINRPLMSLKKAIDKYAENKERIKILKSDVKEVLDITEQFHQMTLKLDEADNMKHQYEENRRLMLASISHDLKTPITVIQGYSKAIMDNIIKGEDVIKKNEIIYNKSCYLDELVNNFHEFSKLDYAKFEYVFEEVDFTEFLRNYLALKYEELENKGIKLEVDIPENKIVKKIDKQQFTRVLENIINNAVKHSGDEVNIKISLDEKALKIANDGEVSSDLKEQDIFEPFMMLDKSRSKGGSGLGLAIVKKIVEEHGYIVKLNINEKEKYKISFDILF